MAAQPDSGRTEQIVSRFLLKALHAILAARAPNSVAARAGSTAPAADAARWHRRDRWFNLALGDLPAALEHHHGVMNPMVVDIILFPLGSADPESVIERWTVQCESSSPSPWHPDPVSSSSSSSPVYWKVYKKSIVLLRALYTVLRLLPAHRVCRMLHVSSQSYNYDVGYKFSSFAEPFSRKEEREFRLYSFTSVETQVGHLSVSVMYRPSLSGFNLEVSSLTPPMIINDYVGSPAAEGMRAFPPSPSDRGFRATSFPSRSGRLRNPPLFSRPHSWTSAPLAHYPLGTSPASSEGYGHHRAVSEAQTSVACRKGAFDFDEYKLSPPFLMSPSPPTLAGSPLHSRLRPETAPLTIPQGKSQMNRSPNLSDPTRNLWPPPSPRSASTKGDPSSLGSPSDGRFLRKLEGLGVGNLYPNLHLYAAQKGLKDAKDDSGRFSGVFSSSGSPRFGFSRSSSRLSIQDELDDGDFSCPFAVDDVDTMDSPTRNMDGKERLDSVSSRRSQDIAVSVLAHMFKTAAPLRQDHSYSCQPLKSEHNPGDGGASSFFMSRRASEALEELQSYKELKNMILSRSGSQFTESANEITNFGLPDWSSKHHR